MLYRNLKNGHLYRVLHQATDATNARDGNAVVVYCRADLPSPQVFVRDSAEFGIKFTPASGADLALLLDNQRKLNPHIVSSTCEGERCACGAPAAHKVGEEIAFDDLSGLQRHNLTTYLCCAHFSALFGRAAACPQ